jgi:hypothetical protein
MQYFNTMLLESILHLHLLHESALFHSNTPLDFYGYFFTMIHASFFLSHLIKVIAFLPIFLARIAHLTFLNATLLSPNTKNPQK